MQLVVGVLLLIFGLQWLRKAILRSTGYIALHDEEQAFADREGRRAARTGGTPLGLDWYAFTVSFKGVLLEGLEVVFIVVGFGASAQIAGLRCSAPPLPFGLVLLVGIAVHRPLSRVPENLIKYGVGLLLSTFGLFWLVEGLNAVAPERRTPSPGPAVTSPCP